MGVLPAEDGGLRAGPGAPVPGVFPEEVVPVAAPVATRHVDEREQIGRNDPCWCGSGKKFKKCHGA